MADIKITSAGGGGGEPILPLYLLRTSDILNSDLQRVEDIDGNNSPLWLSTEDVTGTGVVTGSRSNTAFGGNCLFAYDSSVTINNSAYGSRSMENNLSGLRNCSFGADAMRFNDDGINNCAFGYSALRENIDGLGNVAIGNLSMVNNLDGNQNVAIGAQSLEGNNTGDQNVAIGLQSLHINTEGSLNVAVGAFCLNDNDDGNYNSALGANVKSNDYSSCVILGYEAEPSGNNQFVVGAIGTPAGQVQVEANVSTQVWNVIINGVARKILLA